jgi:DNA helicase HerA-like ATPase
MITGGKALIIVGMTGSGKSTLVKKYIAPVARSRLWLHDVNGEYFPDEPEIPIDDFITVAAKLRESVIVFEEATIFFSNRGSNKIMRDILVRKRHRHNCIILVFHSIRSIPVYIFDLCNYVTLFRTNDTEDLVRTKNPLLLNAFEKVKNKKFVYGLPVENFCETIKIN